MLSGWCSTCLRGIACCVWQWCDERMPKHTGYGYMICEDVEGLRHCCIARTYCCRLWLQAPRTLHLPSMHF